MWGWILEQFASMQLYDDVADALDRLKHAVEKIQLSMSGIVHPAIEADLVSIACFSPRILRWENHHPIDFHLQER